MRKVWLAVLGLTVIGYGCGPQLAQSPYGQKETQWEGYVKKSYPSWTPAKTIPPVEQQAAAEQAAAEQAAAAEQQQAEVVNNTTIAPISSNVQNTDALNLAPLQPMSESPDMPSVAPKHGGKEYTVKKGDTLGSIAKANYGSAGKWRLIRDANRDKIPDPNKVKVGTKITLPAL